MATASRFIARTLKNSSSSISRHSLKLLPRVSSIYGTRFNSTSQPDPDRETGILKTYQVTKADARPVVSEHHEISFDDKKVLIPWEEGKTSYYQHLWLRDHCQCPACRHPETKQRLVNTFDIPRNIKPVSVEGSEAGLKLTWKDGHESVFPWDWLHLHSYAPRLERYLSPQFHLWGSEIENNPPEVNYEEVMASNDGVALWVSKIYKYGFCYVSGVPVTPEATKELIERIAFIRETHYGGFWDFTADLAKKDMAYTNLALGVHTDTTYFTDPAGLQMFHLLEHSGGSGGQSILVDGFRAAKILREENPQAYKTLSNVRIPAHASGNHDSSIQPFAPFPVLNHHPSNGELVQIRWNNDDRATMDRWDDLEDVEEFYDAARAWNDILRRQGTEYWEQLKPGRALIFDNWRVLHGRSAFSGKRRLCGGYVNMDDYKSRLRTLSATRERLLKSL
ncbi:hypothetical protein BZA77DRAFT_306617 [Pyronema omphalodes]|nr:hypothetical protein BZA77DRAFT_306617 [Pyronema omphalodes]